VFSFPERSSFIVTDIKIANPGPLGLSGFALTTFILSLVNAGVLNASDTSIVVGLAVFYGGIAQFSAGMWEFRSGNTFGATAFTSYGAFWLSFAAILIPAFAVKASATAVGYYLVGWTIITGILMLCSFRTNGATALVFIALFVTFLLLAIGALNANTNITHIGGWVGLITAIVAWYTALAGVLTGVSNGKINLPVIPLT
jgi:uncharacterized protein